MSRLNNTDTHYVAEQSAQPPKMLYAQRVADTTLVIQNKLTHGEMVGIRLERIGHSKKKYVTGLSCEIHATDIEEMDIDAQAGTMLAKAVDIISPERCAMRHYRDDGLGYVRALTITKIDRERVQMSISCMTAARMSDGHYEGQNAHIHTESITLLQDDAEAMRERVRLAHLGFLQEQEMTVPKNQRKAYADPRETILDV